jgi:hypothetical protein
MTDIPLQPTDWDLIWAGQADDELIRTVVARSSEQIESFLVSDSETEEETLALLGRRLAGPIDTATYDLVLEAMRALLGEEGANLVHWYTVADGSSSGILEEVAPERVAYFVRRIAAAHRPEFRSAFALWKEVPNDWRSLHREIYVDYLNSRYVVQHRILKVSGEEILIEGNANSVLDLTRSLIVSLNLIGNRDAFGEREIANFLGEADNVIAMLRPPEAPADVEAVFGDANRDRGI